MAVGGGSSNGISRIFVGKKMFSYLFSSESAGTPTRSIATPQDSVQ